MNNINCNLRFPREVRRYLLSGPSRWNFLLHPSSHFLERFYFYHGDIRRCFFKLILNFAPCFNVCHFSSHFWFSSFAQGENFAQLFNISLIIMFILNAIKLPFHFLARDIKILQSSYSPIFPHICFWWKSCCHAHLRRVFHDSKFT